MKYCTYAINPIILRNDPERAFDIKKNLGAERGKADSFVEMCRPNNCSHILAIGIIDGFLFLGGLVFLRFENVSCNLSKRMLSPCLWIKIPKPLILLEIKYGSISCL